MDRPVFCKQKHLGFLDRLKETGITQMWESVPYIVQEFGCTKKEAKKILMYWMASYNDRHDVLAKIC